ncbi:MAG: AIPR family protein [Methanospirillaceae archaeon]|nr:AIPR family protein [Methanospirillaceae archaeon]
MNVTAEIIDQRLTGIMDQIREQDREELGINDDTRLKSLSFVFLTVKTLLDLSDEEAFDCLTEGSGDFGVDAVHVSEECDQEINITLFQGKYKQNLQAESNFPEQDISKLIRAIHVLFDPSPSLHYLNPRLATKVEEIRSLIRDGYITQARVIACNNGKPWNEAAEEEIRRSHLGGQATFEHINHDSLIALMRAEKPVHDTIQFSGEALTEDLNFIRVFIGRVSVREIHNLIHRHGDRLLERNIRRYLGMQGNRVNEAIRDTLLSDEKNNFYFFNNGITLICEKFVYNSLQRKDYPVTIDNLQIINGGQTCITIYKTLMQMSPDTFPDDAYVLVRLYQLPCEDDDLVRQITYATNSQNPVDLRYLRANDTIQKRLETDIEGLGYRYRRKRVDYSSKNLDITSAACAEAILAVWRKRPNQVKFLIREHFGKLYEIVFTDDLNGAQAIIASLLYRIPEARRRRISPEDPPYVRYGSAFIAMMMGTYLLTDLDCNFQDLTHKNFEWAVLFIEQKGQEYLKQAIHSIGIALEQLYGSQEVSLQQLSATFRRGDLIEKLTLI